MNNDKASDMMMNGPGSGGSPNNPSYPGRTHENSFTELDVRSGNPVQSNHEKRYIEILSQSNFLFADKFLKNLMAGEADLSK